MESTMHASARWVGAMALLLVVLVSGAPGAVTFWGAKASRPVGTPPADLKPGEWVWNPAAAPAGPMTVLVSLGEQRGYVYRNGVEIGYASVSSGKTGFETPTGIFTILQKDRDHRSSIYNNASMPFTQRLTWGGVALHAGGLPGYPSSHGCVHLPSAFAEELFEASHMGMTVVVVNGKSAHADVAHPPALAPIDAGTGKTAEVARLVADETFRWEPEKAPQGPVSLLLSGADRRVIVLRNGIEIGRSRIELREPARPLGSHVFVVKQAPGSARSASSPGGRLPTWTAVAVPGYADEAGRELSPDAAALVRVPPAFVARLAPLLTPGTTLVVTDAPVLSQTTGHNVTVLGGGLPE